MMAPKAPYLASAAILYNSRGRSPQPVREASAGPGQNPGSPGPKGPAAGSTLTPVRACQPSGILESTARSRSRAPKVACTLKPQRGLSRDPSKKIHPFRDGFFFISLPFSGLLYLSLFPLSFLSFLQPVLHILPLSLLVLSPYTRRSRGPGRRGGPGGWPRRGRR